MGQDHRVFVRLVLAFGALLAVAGCSDDSPDEPMTCADVLSRLAEIEGMPQSEGQSWDQIQANVDLSIERDALRAEIAAQDC